MYHKEYSSLFLFKSVLITSLFVSSINRFTLSHFLKNNEIIGCVFINDNVIFTHLDPLKLYFLIGSVMTEKMPIGLSIAGNNVRAFTDELFC
jgi:hypothetical protein